MLDKDLIIKCPLCPRECRGVNRIKPMFFHLMKDHYVSKEYILDYFPSKYCVCECGNRIKPWNNYLNGHNPSETTFKKGQEPFNKGKSLEELFDEKRVHEIKKLNSLARKGKPSSMLGKHHTPETNEKNRQAHLGKKDSPETIEKKRAGQSTPEMKEFHRNNILKKLEEGTVGWFISGHYRGENYPEKQFRTILESHGLIKDEDFFQEYKINRFLVDFAIPEFMYVIEIDGPQHETSEGIEKDKKRDKIISNLGWVIFRIPARELKSIRDKVCESKQLYKTKTNIEKLLCNVH
mgnify:CR=1 FL=1